MFQRCVETTLDSIFSGGTKLITSGSIGKNDLKKRIDVTNSRCHCCLRRVNPRNLTASSPLKAMMRLEDFHTSGFLLGRFGPIFRGKVAVKFPGCFYGIPVIPEADVTGSPYPSTFFRPCVKYCCHHSLHCC